MKYYLKPTPDPFNHLQVEENIPRVESCQEDELEELDK